MTERKGELSREQIERLESEIEMLETGHYDMFSRKYAEFFAHAKRIGQIFKESRALSQADRQWLWERFNTICENARQEQERQREDRRNKSRIKKEIIEDNIREAYHWAKGADSMPDLQEAEHRLQIVTEKMKDGWSGFTGTTEFFETITGNEGRLTKEDRDYLWEKWREAKAAIRERREWLSELHYDHMRDVAGTCLSLAETDPRAAKERIKKANSEMKQKPMNSIQYSEVRRMLDEAWERASETASERHNDWRQRMEGHVERWTELMEKNEDVIANLERQIEHCEEMEANARSDDFAETVRGWVEEKLEKIRDIRRTNEELEERIESVKSKLSK